MPPESIEPTPEMVAFYERRTREHIERVRKCLTLLANVTDHRDELLARAEGHDASKFGPEERIPYVWLTEFHRCRRSGEPFEYPVGMAEAVQRAMLHKLANQWFGGGGIDMWWVLGGACGLPVLAVAALLLRLVVFPPKWVYRYDDGTREASGPIDRGDKDGLWRFWHRNGRLAAKGYYEHGEKIGHWVYWHDNGTKAVEGDYSGTSGPPISVGSIMGNAQGGKWLYWHANGQRRAEGRFSAKGDPVGQWRFWDDAGNETEGDPSDYRVP